MKPIGARERYSGAAKPPGPAPEARRNQGAQKCPPSIPERFSAPSLLFVLRRYQGDLRRRITRLRRDTTNRGLVEQVVLFGLRLELVVCTVAAPVILSALVAAVVASEIALIFAIINRSEAAVAGMLLGGSGMLVGGFVNQAVRRQKRQ